LELVFYYALKCFKLLQNWPQNHKKSPRPPGLPPLLNPKYATETKNTPWETPVRHVTGDD